MANEKEILRYEFDLTDVEAKAARIIQIQESIKAKAAGGQGTDELGAQLNSEIEGLGKLAKKKEESASLDRELTGLVRGLASSFGELGNRAMAAVDSMLHAGPVVGIIAGITAAVAALAAAWREVVEAARRASEEQERANAAARGMQNVKVDAAGRMGGLLQGMGALRGNNLQLSEQMAGNLRQNFGFERGDAEQAAAVAIASGLSEDEAAVLSEFGHAPGGQMPANPRQGRRALAAIRSAGVYSALLTRAAPTVER